MNSSTTTITGQPYQSSSTHPVGVAPSPIPSMQISPATLAPFLDIPESHSNTKLVNNLVKPSSFFVPLSSSPTSMPRVSSSVPTAPLLHPAVSLQRPYGAPLLQPFPPPAPPPSLTPASFPIPNCGPVNRDKVRNALMLLVQVSFHYWCYIVMWLLSLFSWEDRMFALIFKIHSRILWQAFQNTKCTRNIL